MKAVVTVIGKDQKGIIAKVSNILYAHEVNILDISQTVMQDMFTMIMLVNFESDVIPFKDVTDALDECGEGMGLSIHVQREEIFTSMHRI